MNLNKIKKYLIISLVLFEVCVIHLAYKSFSNKPVKLPEVKLKEIEKEKKNTYAVMIDDGNGGYTESTEDKFPTEGYKLNTEKSGCIDNEGNAIENVLSVVDNKVLVSTGSTTYCYLYFDKKPASEEITDNPIPGVVESTDVAEDELAVRYYGTNPPNYICFGTTNKSTCTSADGQKKYMYRIIGVDKSGRFKLIKKTPIEQNGNKIFYWHNVYNQDIKWNASDLYKGLNGISGGTYNNLFIGNTTYVPSGWADKIETVNWKYGDIYDASNAHNATNVTAAGMVQKEQAWSTTVSAKIGLMYLADYYFGLSKTGTNCSAASNSTYPTCKTSWIYLSQNDTTVSENGVHEWTMSRYGLHGEYYRVWIVAVASYVTVWDLNKALSIRPVFYLISNTIIKSGTGTINDPYIIK